MREQLPPIQIRVREAPALFQERMADIAERSGAYITKTEESEISGMTWLSVTPKASSRHRGLLGQFLVNPKDPHTVSVEIRAGDWSPDHDPTYDAYGAAARALVGPLLRTYNRQQGTRYRLTIASAASLEPKLPPKAEGLFKRFTSMANTINLHPLDWQRFYEFVRDSRMRTPLSEEDMARLLIRDGFTEQYALKIAGVYDHLIRFKRVMQGRRL